MHCAASFVRTEGQSVGRLSFCGFRVYDLGVVGVKLWVLEFLDVGTGFTFLAASE